MRAGIGLRVRRSLARHALSSGVAVVSIALACGLAVAVFSLRTQAERAFTESRMGFDAVLGARGSPLQLVLNSVFHLETSPGNLPWSMFEAIATNTLVKRAVPYVVGDSYRGHRIVGTFAGAFDHASAPRLRAGGRLFAAGAREAVVGAAVAEEAELERGARFKPYHGLVNDAAAQHDEEFTVVGVLEATGGPADRAIWVPLEALYAMSGHVLRGAGEERRGVEAAGDRANWEVSAVMLELRSPQAGFALDQLVNKQGKVATLAWPIATVMADLFRKLGWATRVLGFVAYLVVVVAAGTILAAVSSAMNERRREMAILRALGARRAGLSLGVVLESATLGAAGSILGLLVFAGLAGIAREIVRRQTGVALDPWVWHPVFAYAPLGATALASVAGAIPAVLLYRTDVATQLASTE